MQITGLEVDRDEARKRVEQFTASRRKKLTEMDRALYQGYKALAEGLTLIDVNKAIRDGGHFDGTYCPKLAIARSDVQTVHFDHTFRWDEGLVRHWGRMGAWQWSDTRNDNALYVRTEARAGALARSVMDVAAADGLDITLEDIIDSPMDERKQSKRWYKDSYQSIVPPIPFHLRPNGDAENYFILWEVEKWEMWRAKRAPGDPLLLERIAHPIYVVVAQWDLTELEKQLLESFR